MHTLPIRRLLALTTLTLALGACGDSTGSDNPRSGEIEFGYSGAASGQFNAEGELRQSNRVIEFAAAFRDVDQIQLIAVEKTGTDRGNLFLLAAPAEERTTTCTAATAFFDCRLFAAVALGLREGSDEPDQSFSGYVGSVEVTEITEKRIRGRFSFTLGNDEFQGAASSIEVRSGTFDVPIMESSLEGSPVRAAVARLNARRQGSARR